MRPEFKGPLILVAAMLCYSAMSALVRVAGPIVPSVEVVFFRAIVGLPFLYWLARRNGVALTGQRKGLLIWRGVFGTLAVICFFHALMGIPVANALLLNQTSAVFILPLAVVFLGERVSWAHALFVVLALLGVALIVKPSTDAIEIHALFALGSAVLAAVALTMVRKLTATESSLTIVFWFSSIIALITLPMMIPVFVWPSPKMWAVLIGMSLLGTFGQVLMTLAYRYSEAGKLAVIGSMGAVFGAGWDWLLWAHIPDLYTVLGGVLVITACAVIQTMRHKKSRQQK